MLQRLSSSRWRVIGGASIALAAIGGGITGGTQAMDPTAATVGAACGGIAGLIAGTLLSSAISRREALNSSIHKIELYGDVLPVNRSLGHMHRPSWLLMPDNQIAPFRARRADLEFLGRWCSSAGGYPLLLVTGRSYVGKTRFIVEFARLYARSWRVIRAREGHEIEIFESLTQAKGPSLLTIESSQSHIHLIELIERLMRLQRDDIKIIIISRTDSWHSFLISNASDSLVAFVDSATQLELYPVGSKDDLLRWLIETTAEICKLLDIPEPPPPHIGPSVGVTMMEVTAMAIVAALEGEHLISGTLSNSSPTIAEIGNHLVKLESKFWRMPGQPFGADGTVERRCIWLLGVLGAANESEAVTTACRLPDLENSAKAVMHSLVRWIREMYPSSSPDSWIGGPQPDFLAHALSYSVLERDDWLTDLLRINIPGNPSLSDAQFARALRAIAQAASIFPDITPAFTRMIRTTPISKLPITIAIALYLDDTIKADQALAEFIMSAEIELESVKALEDMVDIRFVNVRAAITAWKVKESRTAGDPRSIAQLLMALSDRQGLADQAGNAMDAADEAVRLYRALAAAEPKAYQAHLAAALARLAEASARLHRFTVAADAADEAVRLYRALAAAEPKAYQAHLAAALVTWLDSSPYPSKHDQGMLAVTAAEQAVNLYGDLASADHESYDGALSEAMEKYAEELRALEKHRQAAEKFREALAVAQQAVQHPIRLGAISANTQRASVARSWQRIGHIAKVFGLDNEERAAVGRVVGIYRALFKLDPSSYRYDLVNSLEGMYLANISVSDSETDVHAAEALALARAGDGSDNIVYYSNLVSALRPAAVENDASAYSTLAEERVNLYRLIDQGNQYFDRHDGALWNLAMKREDEGLLTEADQLFREAIKVCARHYDAGIYGPYKRLRLAQAMRKYELFLERTGRYAEALKVVEEIIKLYPDWSAEVLRRDFSYLSGALMDREKLLLRLGRTEEARQARELMARFPIKKITETALNFPVYSAGDSEIAGWFEQVFIKHHPTIGMEIAARNAIWRKNSS